MQKNLSCLFFERFGCSCFLELTRKTPFGPNDFNSIISGGMHGSRTLRGTAAVQGQHLPGCRMSSDATLRRQTSLRRREHQQHLCRRRLPRPQLRARNCLVYFKPNCRTSDVLFIIRASCISSVICDHASGLGLAVDPKNRI